MEDQDYNYSFTCGVNSANIMKNLNNQTGIKSQMFITNSSSIRKNNIMTQKKNRSSEKLIIQAKKSKIEINKNNEQISRKEIILIGYVENIFRWNVILKNKEINILYNVLGIYINKMDGLFANEKYVYIKGNNGMILECSYFEIDCKLPIINKGQFVGCFGQITGIQKLKMYKIEILNETDYNEAQRAIFLSQRAVYELK